jgi:DNA-binding CsgD family transcriptional regulator
MSMAGATWAGGRGGVGGALGVGSPRARRSGCDRLSGKERKVLAELARGNTTEEIGLLLEVSPHTVRTHVKNLMRKLGARTRAHAVAIALSESAIDFTQ